MLYACKFTKKDSASGVSLGNFEIVYYYRVINQPEFLENLQIF